MNFDTPESGIDFPDPPLRQTKVVTISPEDALAAISQAHRRGRQSDLTKTQWKVLTVVTDLTAIQLQVGTDTYTATVARLAKLGAEGKEPARRAADALRELRQLGVIEYEHGRRKKEHSLVSLPPAELF